MSMHVLVLGAGVIGTTTAYFLAQQGAQVTVLDRQPAPAQETSFANAGQVSPGYSTPWAAPGIPLKAIKWLFQRHAPLAVRPDGSLFQLRWMLQMLANCNAASYATNKERMMRLSEYSRDCLRQLRQDTGIAYEARTQGTLQVFRTQAQVDAAARDIAVLSDMGVPFELLDAPGLLKHEPGLATNLGQLRGGLHLPGDETGDCHLFTQRLAEKAKALGVRFVFGAHLEHLTLEQGALRAVRFVQQDSGQAFTVAADRCVLALGSYSRQWLGSLGIDVPVYPVKGYSLTLDITPGAPLPESTILDETYKVAVTRFDRRIRVGGMAELGGFDLRLNPRRRETLEMVVQSLFPGQQVDGAGFWTGLRPMTPDGTPLIGPTRIGNVFINTGHGTLGWTMACGSGRMVADMVLGKKPDVRADDLGLSRYDKQPAQAARQGGTRQYA
jgi:D-amino-acid dehydrogenase